MRWNHADAALVAAAMVGAALLIRGQIDAPPTAPVPVQAHPLIGSADTLAPGRVCVELWWDESTPDPSDDGWVYAWGAVSYTHLRAHETVLDLVCRLLLENKH